MDTKSKDRGISLHIEQMSLKVYALAGDVTTDLQESSRNLNASATRVIETLHGYRSNRGIYPSDKEE